MNQLDSFELAVPWSIKDILLALLALAGAFLLTIVGIAASALLTGRMFATPSASVALLWLSLLEGGLLAAAWYFAAHRYRLSWAALGFRPLAAARAIPLVLAALGAAYISMTLYTVAIRLFGWDGLLPVPLPPRLLQDPSALLPLALTAVLLAPLAEETFFRGFVFPGVRRRFGLNWGALVSAGLFGAVHLQVGLLVPFTILGLILVWVYVKSGSLWAPVATHTIYNALALAAIV